MNIKIILEHYLAWFKAHERLVLLIAIGFFGVHFYGKTLEYLIKRDQTAAQIATKKVEVDAAANKQLSDQLADLKLEVAKQSVKLAQVAQQRAKQTEDQKKKNDEAPPSVVADRIIELLKIPSTEIVPAPNGLLFSNEAAHADVNALEDLKQAQADRTDLQTSLAGCSAVTAKQDTLIAGLNQQLTDEQVSHKSDVALEKAKAKRSFLRGFKWGLVTGIAGVEAIRVFIFHKP